MELSELARAILMSPDLADKLHWPEQLSDRRPGPPIAVPAWPARRGPLRLDLPRERAPFPSLQALEKDENRGRVLHFFANHELLAMELMALLLLRFPDAPAEFRMGLAHTIHDEQRHMGLYLQHMRALGVDFGEIPVSPYFWGTLKDMATPMDFVAGMSLTFEQANLDFCLHFEGAFTELGDAVCADIMRRVYEDEISHVQHGLRWFRRWKEPGEDDFDAWQRALPAPLTPARAKGPLYDEDARRRIGLDESFIDRLRVWSASKGRPPTLRWFNPGCERSVADPAWRPDKAVAALRQDLQALPMFWSHADDAVLVERRPDDGWLAGLQALDFPLPEFITDADTLQQRTLGSIEPFGWSPAAEQLLGPGDWQPQRYRKSWSQGWLARVLPELDPELVGGPELLGLPVHSLDELDQAAEQLRAQGHDTLLLKQDLGSSGQGQRRLRGALTGADRRWAAGVLQRQGAMVVEGLLDKVLDLSAQYRGGRFRGFSRPLVDNNGRYQGQVVSRLWDDQPPAVRRFLHGEGRDPKRLLRCFQALAAEHAAVGDWGLDALVYRWQGELRLKPIVECNPRSTMGTLALALAPRISRGVPAQWRLYTSRQLGDLGAWAAAQGQRFPPQVTRRPKAQLEAGLVFTNEPARARTFLGVLAVGERALSQLP